MKLSTFIQQTLSEIAFGIHLAKAECSDLVAISPGTLNGDRITEKSYVNFDIALTVGESSQASSSDQAHGKAKTSIFVVQAGIDGKISSEEANEKRSEMVSRLTFAVPVYLNAHFRGDESSKAESEFVRSLSKQRALAE